jgi:hypothetical protein
MNSRHLKHALAAAANLGLMGIAFRETLNKYQTL